MGDVVYFWRRQKPRNGRSKLLQARWFGPGVVVGLEGQNAWISNRGTLVKAVLECTRKATDVEMFEAVAADAALLEMPTRRICRLGGDVYQEEMRTRRRCGHGGDEDKEEMRTRS